ncbi:MAG: YjdF family protein [Syntrophomonadaceae bacterium]|nr:YjdF family protein [Syntrophomonadaceae bacterium]
MNIKLTVFFEEPFWVGVFERIIEGEYSTSKYVFGAEPKNQEILDLVISIHKLPFSKPISMGKARPVKLNNPKRMQRAISREMSRRGISTKAQESIKAHYLSTKQQNKELVKIKNEAMENRKFELKQQKKREKHRGH